MNVHEYLISLEEEAGRVEKVFREHKKSKVVEYEQFRLQQTLKAELQLRATFELARVEDLLEKASRGEVLQAIEILSCLHDTLSEHSVSYTSLRTFLNQVESLFSMREVQRVIWNEENYYSDLMWYDHYSESFDETLDCEDECDFENFDEIDCL